MTMSNPDHWLVKGIEPFETDDEPTYLNTMTEIMNL